MDRKTMLKRIKAGYNAIDISLEKWQDIKTAIDNGERYIDQELDSNNCALCKLYMHNGCIDCPLYKIGDKCEEGGASWLRANAEHNPQIVIDALLKAKDWQQEQKCEDNQIEHVEEKKEQIYRIGQRFKSGMNNEYLLAYVETIEDEKRVILIAIEDGKRWSNPVVVKDEYKITESEIVEITGGNEYRSLLTLIDNKDKK